MTTHNLLAILSWVDHNIAEKLYLELNTVEH